MSTISPQEQQWYKELVTPFQPMGRLLVGADLRGAKCDRFGNGNPRLVGYGDSSGGYVFSPSNQDAAIAPSFNSANLSNIANSLPRITEVQDNAGKWIDTITLHALDEFIEQGEAQSFIPNTLRIFSGSQKGFRSEGTGNRPTTTQYTLLAEIPIPALTRADVPRSFTVSVGVYIPPSENIYLGLAIEQPYSASFELWDLQANTQVGSGFSSSIGGSSSVGEGNDLSDSLSDTPVDTQFVLPLTFASATWVRGASSISGGGSGGEGNNPSPPPPPPTPDPPPGGEGGGSSGGGGQDDGGDESQPPPNGNGGSGNKEQPKPEDPPSGAGCIPIQDCQWYKVNVPSTVGQAQVNTGDYTGLCPKGTISRGIAELGDQLALTGTYVLCCGPATFPPNNLGCSSLIKYSCASGGVCIEDELGTYNSLAECQAALVPAGFTGGQCVTRYIIFYDFEFINEGVPNNSGSGSYGNPSPNIIGPIFSVSAYLTPFGSGFCANVRVIAASGTYEQTAIGCSTSIRNFTISNVSVVRSDGLPDNCGNPPPTCP